MPTTLTPCEQLALAQQQMILLLSGKATVSVETPQLGRVQFNQTTMADLQRLINQLQVECDPTGSVYLRRRPLSIEAWP
jgi:hypothetical protein